MQLFEEKRPPHMRNVPWELIITLVFELFKRWISKQPQAVIDAEEADDLGLESE